MIIIQLIFLDFPNEMTDDSSWAHTHDTQYKSFNLHEEYTSNK